MHAYSVEEIEYLKSISYGRSSKEITEMFNRKFGLDIGVKAVSSVRKRYGIITGRTGRFEKGQKSWNKDKKGLTGANKTSFKKGNKPVNYLPVGSERVNGDDYVDIKIADPNVWKGKHILEWERYNGPVPDGHCIIFGDRNNRNFNLENLICVSRSQLLTLNNNNLIKEDIELTKIGINIADVKLKIGEVKRRNNKLKNGKKPSLIHKKIMQSHGLDSSKWLVVKDLNSTLEVVSRDEFEMKGNHKKRTIILDKKRI